MASLPPQPFVDSVASPESLNIKELSLSPSTTTNSYESNTTPPTTTTTLDLDRAPPSQSQTTDPTSSNSNQDSPLAPDGDNLPDAKDPSHNEEKAAEETQKTDWYTTAEKVKKPDWYIKARAARKRNSVLRPGYNKKHPKDSAYASVRANANGESQGEGESKPEALRAGGTDDASKQEG